MINVHEKLGLGVPGQSQGFTVVLSSVWVGGIKKR